MLKIKIFLVALIVLVAAPQVSLAYFTTEQTATKLTADTLLYTITYRFGFLNRELRMPIGAFRGIGFTDASPYAGYEIMDDGESVFLGGQTYGVVLSKAEVVDGEYYLPAGKAADFTLVTLVKLPPELQAAAAPSYDLSLLMTSLPFTMIKEDGEEVFAKLNPSELQYYVTPELDIN